MKMWHCDVFSTVINIAMYQFCICHTWVNYNSLGGGCGVHSPFLSLCHIQFHFTKHLNGCCACLCSFGSLSSCQTSTTNALFSQSRPAQAVFRIDTNSIIVSNYKYLGVFEWKLNYKSYKTRIKLLELLIGAKGAIKLSLRYNWPDLSKAAGIIISVWFIVSALVVSLYKYPFASSPRGHEKSQVWMTLASCSICSLCIHKNPANHYINGWLTDPGVLFIWTVVS